MQDGIKNSKLLYNYDFYKYDHKTRTWEVDKIQKTSIDDALVKGSVDSIHNSLFLRGYNEDSELSNIYQFPPIHQHKLYDVLSHLELFSSNIQFTIDGDLNLDIGQVITIKENSSEKTEMFNGKWLIIKIRHSFRNKEYKTNLICSRTYSTKAV